ncbi:LppX_LprAFG lipoprotein [Kribbella qitaiheensis]|uniref:LppX_LprAFG lipoprotein n=1 Tax=Kribbella qitaiheensis TaxID=1544730 RepID=A0A7G6X043_9ACTN|nr:LppX_LprAFG lipoprotein [Kribbella qitaiheensis]QNE19608.1 LppX_LprAFG lipoprotein [Kribbella qitaiheensis]
MKFGTRLAAVAVALPLALGLAACGGSDGKNSANGSMPSVPVSTETAPTSAPPTTAPPAPVAHLNRVTFLPAMNTALTKQKTWRTTATMTAGGQTIMTITGYQQAKPLAASMTMTGQAFEGKSAKIIVLGSKLYMSMPGATPAGKYLMIDTKVADPAGIGAMVDSADPTKTFKALGIGMKNVKFIGPETVDGVKLDHYELTVDTAAALKTQSKKLPAGTPKTLPYSLWLGADHLVHKMSFDAQGISMVMNMNEYNKPVTITAPPASKIVKR